MSAQEIRDIEIDNKYGLGEIYRNVGWTRLTLFHIERNSSGGSTRWPVAEIDVVDHPSKDGCNAHTEVKVSIRNDVKLASHGIEVDHNKKHLRHPNDVIERGTVNSVITRLKESEFVTEPYSLYVCMRHVEDFWVKGDFWSNDP
jgi:hypothetical protein